jgi:hypothetical protein
MPILLRNYENFPTEIGNDLDVYVSPARLARAFSILASCAFEQGGKIAHIHRRGYFVAIWLQFSDCEAPVHIDLYHGALTWHGLRFLSDHELESNSQETGTGLQYRIPAPSHEALVSLLASILWGGFFKIRYQDHLAALLADPLQRQAFTAHLEQTFGRNGRVLAAAVVRNEAASIVHGSFARKLRRGLVNHALKTSLFNSCRDWFRHWLEECACYGWRLPGMLVEYDDDSWQADEVNQIREQLGLYFGETHSMNRQHAWFSRYLMIRRLRGKNHLVLLRGKRFAINGHAWHATADQTCPSTASMAKAALRVLACRIEFQGCNK